MSEEPTSADPQTCTECGYSLSPLPTIHVERNCPKCSRRIYVPEPGEHGRGIRVRKGDNLVLPPGLLRLSLDPNESTFTFTRAGLAWLAKLLYFEQHPPTPEGISSMLDSYEHRAKDIVEKSALLGDLNLETEEGQKTAYERIKGNEDSVEFWALAVANLAPELKNSLDGNDAQRAVWIMSLIDNARSMAIFKQQFQEPLWRGHMVGRLKQLIGIWRLNQHNSDEEFWHLTLAENSYALSQVYSFPSIVIKNKAYVGGKSIDDVDGKVVDFLMANQLTENAALVEIKTPVTKLMGSKYRGDVYSVAKELTGAIAQVLTYKHSLASEYDSLVNNSDKKFYAFDPHCLVICGNYQNEIGDRGRRTSFELFRSNLKDVQVITYDELFRKVELLIQLFEGKHLSTNSKSEDQKTG